MINKHQALTVTVDDMKGLVDVSQDKHAELDNRVGHLEALSVKVDEVVSQSCKDTQELVKRLGTLEAKVVNLEDKLESQNVNWPRLESNKEGALPQQRVQEHVEPDSVISEVYERKRRENNLVMYGVPESSSSVINERIEHDRKCAADFMRACGVSAEDKIFEAFRMGRTIPGKHRPLL